MKWLTGIIEGLGRGAKEAAAEAKEVKHLPAPRIDPAEFGKLDAMFAGATPPDRTGFAYNPALGADRASAEFQRRHGKFQGVENTPLDMSHAARMQRAKEQGFDADTPLYRGDAPDLNTLNQSKNGATWLTSDPRIADEYLQAHGGEGAIYPVFARGQFGVRDRMNFADRRALREGREDGMDGVLARNIDDSQGSGVKSDVYGVFDNKNIRSVNAAFDPAKRDSKDLLASALLGTGIFGAATAGGSQQESDAGPLNPFLKLGKEAFLLRGEAGAYEGGSSQAAHTLMNSRTKGILGAVSELDGPGWQDFASENPDLARETLGRMALSPLKKAVKALGATPGGIGLADHTKAIKDKLGLGFALGTGVAGAALAAGAQNDQANAGELSALGRSFERDISHVKSPASLSQRDLTSASMPSPKTEANAFRPTPGGDAENIGATAAGSQAPVFQTLRDVESSVNARNGPLYMRWSNGPQFDMAPGAQSRDYQSGTAHAGLSAVEVDKNWLGPTGSRATFARRLAEYNSPFFETGDFGGHLYGGRKIGVDSDGYPSIAPTNHLGSIAPELQRALTQENIRRLGLEEAIARADKELLSVPPHDAITRSVLQRSRAQYADELSRLGTLSDEARSRLASAALGTGIFGTALAAGANQDQARAATPGLADSGALDYGRIAKGLWSTVSQDPVGAALDLGAAPAQGLVDAVQHASKGDFWDAASYVDPTWVGVDALHGVLDKINSGDTYGRNSDLAGIKSQDQAAVRARLAGDQKQALSVEEPTPALQTLLAHLFGEDASQVGRRLKAKDDVRSK